MNILNKIDNYLTEKKAPKEILNWVADYIEMRKAGNVKGSKEIKKNIDKEIKKLSLNKKEVYNTFGDPENPSNDVMKKIKEFRSK